MTSEQLLATRATLWRQKAEPLLTLDDAQSWLQQCGLCLFLPRKAQIPAPAPSFVEACLGETNPTPPRTAIDGAKDLLVRLIEADPSQRSGLAFVSRHVQQLRGHQAALDAYLGGKHPLLGNAERTHSLPDDPLVGRTHRP